MTIALRLSKTATGLLLALSVLIHATPAAAQDTTIDICVLNPQVCADYDDAYPEPPLERPHDDHVPPEPEPTPEPEPAPFPHDD